MSIKNVTIYMDKYQNKVFGIKKYENTRANWW